MPDSGARDQLQMTIYQLGFLNYTRAAVALAGL
ncbi:hypothetical protein BH10CHL1_BH10CHL1_22970 [soil metagenome]